MCVYNGESKMIHCEVQKDQRRILYIYIYIYIYIFFFLSKVNEQ